MGIIKNNIITGPVGPIMYRELNGKQIIQSIGKDPKQTEATKQSAALFGKASRIACKMRDRLYPYSFYDKGMINRCTKDVRAVLGNCYDKKTDTYTFNKDSFNRLTGFEFNIKSLLINSIVMQPQVILQNNVLTISMPELEVQPQLKFPAGAKKCRPTLRVYLYAPQTGYLGEMGYRLEEISKGQITAPEQNFVITVPQGVLCTVSLHLQFYAIEDDVKTVINSKDFEPAGICAALVNPGIFETADLNHEELEWNMDKDLILDHVQFNVAVNDVLHAEKPVAADHLVTGKIAEKQDPEAIAHNKTLDVARNFKNMGIAVADIAKGTGLSIKEIEEL